MTTIQQLQAHLEKHSWPRLNCMLMVALSTAAAFLTAVLLLGAGVSSMALRYGAAALVGYIAFVLLIRGWVLWKRRQLTSESTFDPGDVVSDLDILLPRSSEGEVQPPMFVGGRSGGGGSSASYGSTGGSSGGGSGSGITFDIDADDLVWLLIALAAAFAGVAAIGYLIYVAPALLAEAILDMLIAGGIYRRLQRHDASHWTSHVFRRTAIPAIVVVLSAALAGYALQRVAPEAQSIGGVWAHLSQ